MTTIRVKPISEDGSESILGVVTVTLVDQSGNRLIGWSTETHEPISVHISKPVKDAAVTFDLPPNTIIGSPVGTTAYYHFKIATPEFATQTWLVQVPDSASVIDLFDLVEAEEIASFFPANRLPPAEAEQGQLIAWDETLKRWVAISVPPGAGDMQSLVYDPFGVHADVFQAGNLRGSLDGGTFN